jgi:hypothetical protein
MSNREQWLQDALNEVSPVFAGHGYPLPDKIRVTCGFPAGSRGGKRIGEHWSPVASDDAHHEILISPTLADSSRVLDVLVHELCHASTLGDGHGKKFGKIARLMKLEGKLTATTGGDAFKQDMANILQGLGDYPHAKLNLSDRKKQGTRLLKAVCPACGYTVRVTAKWAVFGLPICPVDNVEMGGE